MFSSWTSARTTISGADCARASAHSWLNKKVRHCYNILHFLKPYYKITTNYFCSDSSMCERRDRRPGSGRRDGRNGGAVRRARWVSSPTAAAGPAAGRRAALAGRPRRRLSRRRGRCAALAATPASRTRPPQWPSSSSSPTRFGRQTRGRSGCRR